MQKCNDISLAPTHAIQISGHKNVASANSYSRLNEQQQKSISTAIVNTSGERHPAIENPCRPTATVTRPKSPSNNGSEILRRPLATVTSAGSPCGNNREILSHFSPTSGSPNFPLSQTNLTYSQQATTTSKNELQSFSMEL